MFSRINSGRCKKMTEKYQILRQLSNAHISGQEQAFWELPKPKTILRTCSFQWKPLKPSPGSSCPPRLQYRVVFQTGTKKFHFFQILISQARNKLFENFKSLKSSSGHRLCIRTVIRNLLSSTTPFGGHEDTPILDVFRGISEGRPVNESCQV